MRSGKWKLHLALPGEKTVLEKPVLYDLEADIGEQTDVAAQHPDVVARLKQLADQARAELGDSLTGKAGASTRPSGGRASAN